MFNFSNLKNITSFDIKELFKECLPKGNMLKIDNDDKNNILSGYILIIIGIILSFIALVFLNKGLDANSSSFISKVTIFGIQYNVVKSLILPLTLPILSIIYFLIKKDSKITSIFVYIMLIYSLIYSIYLILTIFNWIMSTFISISLAFLGLLSLIIKLIGNIFIVIGSFNFTSNCGREYKSTDKPIEINIEIDNTKKINIQEEIKNEEEKEEIKSEYNTVDKSNWTYKYCPRCALKVPIGKEVCDHCGCDLRNV